jgi:hypothetical protein
MIVRIDKSFAKNIRKISDTKLLNHVEDLIETLQNFQTIKEIKDLKKAIWYLQRRIKLLEQS